MPSQVRQATSSVGRHSLNRQTTSVKVQLATELHALIALHGRTKGEFFDTDNQSGWERGITSLGEKRVGDDPEDHPVEDMVLQPLTAARLCRSFPDAMRFMSDNGDPLPAWRKGVQHVALNLQCNDLPTQLHAALFRLGGGHGYVLKPSALRGPQPKWPVGSTSVHCTTLRVLSLHHLPTRDECRPLLTAESHHSYEPALSGAAIPPSGSRANVSSPAVRIELHAIGGHCCVSSTLPPTRHASRHHTTRPADGNGFNPAFDERVYCLAAEPRTTVLRLLVEDAGSVAAYETLILGAMRPGYRSIPLRSRLGTPIHKCSVFVHISHSVEDHLPATVSELQDLVEQLRAELLVKGQTVSQLRVELRAANPCASNHGVQPSSIRQPAAAQPVAAQLRV